MTVTLVWHPACERHQPAPAHPERPDRIRALLTALRAPEVEPRVAWSEGQPPDRAASERVHPTCYVAALQHRAARGGGNGFTVPRRPGLPRATYVRDRLAAVDAALDGWKPDVLLVSAGFDSLAGDPLGGFTLEADDVAAWTTALRERVAPAPVVGVLEGGYRLDLLAAGVRAHVGALA